MLKLKKIKPVFTSVLVTAEKYTDSDKISGTDLIDTNKMEGSYKLYQKVVAVGDVVKITKPGDLISINPANYAVKKFHENSMNNGIIRNNAVEYYRWNIVEIDGKEYMLITDRDVEFVIEEYEEIEESSVNIVNSTLSDNEKPKPIEKKKQKILIPDTRIIS